MTKLSNKEILQITQSQLSLDLNCAPADFNKEGIIFCESKDNPGRRPFPRGERHFDMLTMGKAIIVSATTDILPYLQEQLKGKSRDDAFCMPFVYGSGIYFLPDHLDPLPTPAGHNFEFTEGTDIHKLYSLEGFHNAIQYDANHPRPDVLVLLAKKEGKIIGMAGASDDCKMLWQIGIDVLPEYRNGGIAAALTSQLALEILARGKIPYYGTATSNVASQRVAFRAGFKPAWLCVYRGIFDGELVKTTV